MKGEAVTEIEQGDGVGAADATCRVSVLLPRALLDLYPEAQREVAVSAETVRAMIDVLDRRWPGMRDRLCDSRPAIRRHINVFVDGRRATLDAPLRAGADVFILTAVSGG
ncbi:MAG TPA: MoaD/ThiS family protein, partial [Hyphomicrobium zavarzinii]|nr:MoaD/ThiS family protein [Hyphomicrobium zavarzinii]